MAKKPGKLFTAPRVLRSVVAELAEDLANTLLQIEGAFFELFQKIDEPFRTTSRQTTAVTILGKPGDIIQVIPPAAGVPVVLQEATTETLGKTVVVMVEGTLGTVTVTSAGGTVQGAASVVLSGVGVRTFRSDGSGGWWLDRNLITGADIVESDFDWESTLDRGNSSGLFNPFIPAGQFIGFGVEGSLPASGNLRSSANWHINVTGDIVETASAELRFNGPGGVAIEAVATPQTAIGAGDLFLNADGGLGINAGPGTAAANLANGHLVMNASVGFAVHAGATPITAAVSNRLTFTADDQIVLAPTILWRVLTAGVERFRIESSGAWDLAGDEGALGEVLTSQGAGTPPLWAAGGGGGGVSDAYVKTIASYRSV